MTLAKSIFQIAIFILAFAVFNSCGKDAELPELTTAEVADILEPALQKASGGLSQYIQALIDNVAEIAMDGVCDSVYSKMVVYNNSGAVIQGAYSSDWIFDLNCNNLSIPQSAAYTASADATYSTSRIISADDISFSGMLEGLPASLDIYDLICTYTRIGTQEFTGADPKSLNSSLVMNLMNIEIEKAANIIQSGTGTFTLVGDIDGTNISNAGSITFNGGGTATLTIDGETFEVDLD